jgi:hypothetical protein
LTRLCSGLCVDSRTAYPRQVRWSARGYWDASLPRTELVPQQRRFAGRRGSRAQVGPLPVLLEPPVSFSIFHLTLPCRAASVYGEPAILLRLFDAALSCRALPIDRQAPVLLWIFYLALSCRPWTVLGKTPIAILMLDTALPSGTASILSKAAIACGILNSALLAEGAVFPVRGLHTHDDLPHYDHLIKINPV